MIASEIWQVVDVTSSKRAEAANKLADSARIVAYVALAYSPASVAVGVFGMELPFIQQVGGTGVRAFAFALGTSYLPVVLWLNYLLAKMAVTWIGTKLRSEDSTKPIDQMA